MRSRRIMPNTPREFALAAACCAWPQSGRRNEVIRAAAEGGIDWDRFLRIVKRQHVAGLVRDGLTCARIVVPENVADEIGTIASVNARQNLKFGTEAVRIQRLFDDAGVPLVFVKGVTLAQLAYGTLALKYSWDMDLLVPPDAVPQALHLFESIGYRPFPPLPPLTDLRYRRWIEFAREYVLFHETNNVRIELHWKLVDNSHFLSGVSSMSATRLIEVSSGANIRTLDGDDLLNYLCVHGASHGWSRLKWLADVAALLSGDTASELERRLEAAKKSNAEICMAQAVLLCDRLFGMPNLAALSQQLRRSRRNRWLETIALRAMTAEAELGRAAFDKLSIILSQFLLAHGWSFRGTEFWNKMNSPYDLLYGTLPNRLGFLYPLARLVRWIIRRGHERPFHAPPKVARI